MTKDDANKIAFLIGFADSGCPNCVGELVYHANRLFPEFDWVMESEDCSTEHYINDWGVEICDLFIPVKVTHKQ